MKIGGSDLIQFTSVLCWDESYQGFRMAIFGRYHAHAAFKQDQIRHIDEFNGEITVFLKQVGF